MDSDDIVIYNKKSIFVYAWWFWHSAPKILGIS